MPQTVEVRFKGLRREFFLWPEQEEPLRLRDPVVVEAEKGQDFGRIESTGERALSRCGGCSSCSTSPAAPVEAEPPETPLAHSPAPEGFRRVIRRATEGDVQLANELRRSEEEVRLRTIERAREHRLEMRISDTEWQWDRNRLTIFFTAEKRVDFRVLVRELASHYRTRIELRQIGVRDEAARIGGVGRCGREYCCSTWLKELSPVSLGLAKDQHLSLNPSQISGGCGRLLCCLKYEHEFYVQSRKRFPREGKNVSTARGVERVVAVDIFRERVFLRSDEQGPRIIPLLQFREEQEAAPPLTAMPPAPPPHREERRPPKPPQAAAPAPPRAAEPPRATEHPDAAGSPETPAAGRRPRRRRGRRRRGRGEGGSPPSPQPPAGD